MAALAFVLAYHDRLRESFPVGTDEKDKPTSDGEHEVVQATLLRRHDPFESMTTEY